MSPLHSPRLLRPSLFALRPSLSEFTGVMGVVLAAVGSPDATADVVGVVSGESDTDF